MKLILTACIISCFLLQLNGQNPDTKTVNIKNVIINYYNRGTHTDYFLLSNLDGINVDDAWLAIGLNAERKMDGTISVVCKNNNGVSSIEHYYLNKYQPQLVNQLNPSVGLSNIQVSVNQGYLVCQFSRENTFNNYVANIATGLAYMSVAYGQGSFGYHGANKEITAYKLNIAPTTTRPPTTTTTTTPTTTTSTTTTSAKTSLITFPTTRPTFGPTIPTKGQYDSGTFYKLSWVNNADQTTTFFYETDVSDITGSNMWSAFAFSNDLEMGDDDVAMCKYYCPPNSQCFGTIEHYYNRGNYPELLTNESPQIGFSNINVNIVNGKLMCSFRRVNRLGSNLNRYFDSALNYYLLFAKGYSDTNGNVYFHTNYAKSPEKLSFVGSTLSTIGTIPTGYTTKAPGPAPGPPLAEVVEKLKEALLGFISFFNRIVNQKK